MSFSIFFSKGKWITTKQPDPIHIVLSRTFCWMGVGTYSSSDEASWSDTPQEQYNFPHYHGGASAGRAEQGGASRVHAAVWRGRTWIPWQDRDMRRFGFVTFRNVEDAVKVVAASPHAIGNAQVHSAYKRQSRNDQANKNLQGRTCTPLRARGTVANLHLII